MTINVRIAALIAIVSTMLVACGGGGGGGSIDRPVFLQTDSAVVAAEKVDTFFDTNIFPVQDIEGATPFIDLPTTGGPTYTGFIGGVAEAGDTRPIDYLANLSLTVDFNENTLSGRSYGFLSELAGFETPAGEVEFVGFVLNDGGVAALVFSGSGTLSGTSLSAEVFTEISGAFFGTTPSVASGTQATDFVWDDLPLVADSSISDGTWAVAN